MDTELPYRYELWNLDTKTLVHIRVTRMLLDIRDPLLLERGPFVGYPVSYEWRLYQQERELGRWEATENSETEHANLITISPDAPHFGAVVGRAQNADMADT